MSEAVVIFRTEPNEATIRLAQLDSAPPPVTPMLAAEVDGELRAALPLDGDRPIADPFRRTAELVSLLRLRAAQLREARARANGAASSKRTPRAHLRGLTRAASTSDRHGSIHVGPASSTRITPA